MVWVEMNALFFENILLLMLLLSTQNWISAYFQNLKFFFI